MNTRHYGVEAVDVILPRKAVDVLKMCDPYPKPTQVGGLSIPRGAR